MLLPLAPSHSPSPSPPFAPARLPHARCFSSCSSLTNVDFSDATDANIGRSAFSGCKRLVKLTLPSALSRIDEYTFSRCSALVDLTLPTALRIICDDAFSHCSALAKLTLPTGLKTISHFAFSNCTSLTTLIVPAALQLTHIGDKAHIGDTH